MDRDQVVAIVEATVAPVNARVAAFIDAEKESRRVMGTLLARLTTVVAGDKEFKQPGLVDTVANHQRIIDSFTTTQTEAKAEIKGAVKVTMFLGGVAITLINIFVQVYFGHAR